jgi:hypothetical protein
VALVEPYDEKNISRQDRIIRRINVKEHVIWDGNRQRNRISSKLYNKSSGLLDGMSVDIEALILADGVDPVDHVTTPVFTASVFFSAGDVRALGLIIGYEPVADVEGQPDNPYHGEVWLTTQRKSFTRAQKKGLANSANWYVEIPDVDIR